VYKLQQKLILCDEQRKRRHRKVTIQSISERILQKSPTSILLLAKFLKYRLLVVYITLPEIQDPSFPHGRRYSKYSAEEWNY